MDNKLLKEIDEKIEAYTEKLIDDTVKLININSERGEALPGAPFGKGPKEILDTVMEMGKKEGLAVRDYNIGVVSLAMKEGQPELGIWTHGDVVPAGEGWDYEPYNATVIDNEFIVGRGATDNKGQLAAIFNLFKIFKELGISLNYNPALYVGSSEETGMQDLKGDPCNPEAKGFINVCTPPRFSLVPDGGYPIGYGATGMALFYFKSKTPLHNFTITAGRKESPGLAEAIFDGIDFPEALSGCQIDRGDKVKVSASSAPTHGSHPDPKGNMITMLSSALLESGGIQEEDLHILKFFRDISLDINGKDLGIYCESDIMGKTVVSTRAITCEDGYPELEIRLRYPIEMTYDEIFEKLAENCNAKGFDLRGENRHAPYVRDTKSEAFKKLCDIANEITGENGEPFVNGATYAHYLPNGYIYGMSGNLIPQEFKSGRGGAHGIDEVVSVFRLKRSMRIYARALLMLNETEW